MSNLENKSILIVEDEEFLRETIAEFFTSVGAQVQVAANGEVALQMVKKDHFDVVVSDVKMPGGDGIDLMKNINRLEGPKPLCFLCTGHYSPNDSVLLSLGVAMVFEKPFAFSDMLNSVQHFISVKAA